MGASTRCVRDAIRASFFFLERVSRVFNYVNVLGMCFGAGRVCQAAGMVPQGGGAVWSTVVGDLQFSGPHPGAALNAQSATR